MKQKIIKPLDEAMKKVRMLSKQRLGTDLEVVAGVRTSLNEARRREDTERHLDKVNVLGSKRKSNLPVGSTEVYLSKDMTATHGLKNGIQVRHIRRKWLDLSACAP